MYKKTCAICAADFVGSNRAKYCDGCRQTEYLRNKEEKKHIRLGHTRAICGSCKKEFWASGQTICMPCRSIAYRVKKQTERDQAAAKRAARIAREIDQANEAAQAQAVKPQEPKPKTARKRPENAPNYRPTGKIPLACAACVYCEPREDFETGMVCRAEMMLRCRPYAPGAQPLLRKDA